MLLSGGRKSLFGGKKNSFDPEKQYLFNFTPIGFVGHLCFIIFIQKYTRLNSKMFCETAREVFRIIKTNFIGYFGYIQRMGCTIFNN